MSKGPVGIFSGWVVVTRNSLHLAHARLLHFQKRDRLLSVNIRQIVTNGKIYHRLISRSGIAVDDGKCCVNSRRVWNNVTQLCALADNLLNYWGDLVEKPSDWTDG
jgi:hypothetical protein